MPQSNQNLKFHPNAVPPTDNHIRPADTNSLEDEFIINEADENPQLLTDENSNIENPPKHPKMPPPLQT